MSWTWRALGFRVLVGGAGVVDGVVAGDVLGFLELEPSSSGGLDDVDFLVRKLRLGSGTSRAIDSCAGEAAGSDLMSDSTLTSTNIGSPGEPVVNGSLNGDASSFFTIVGGSRSDGVDVETLMGTSVVDKDQVRARFVVLRFVADGTVARGGVTTEVVCASRAKASWAAEGYSEQLQMLVHTIIPPEPE